jgi:hypothetical protein
MIYADIEEAFFFVSMDQQCLHNAYLCTETGQIFYTSEIGDSDELPEDIDDPEKYITIPHKNELDLGRSLVTEFTSTYMPEELDRIRAIFSSKGAYSKYKSFLEKKGLLDKWYQYENERQKTALKQWLVDNNINTTD